MNFIEWLRIAIIGIIEGITEWLPISSTGHMLLFDQFWPSKATSIITTQFWDMFVYVIQFGAILAVITYFFHKLNPLSPHKTSEQRHETLSLWVKVIIGCIPAAVAGVLLNDFIDANLKGSTLSLIIAATLILYGVLYIVIENRNRHRRAVVTSLANLDLRTVLLIGLAQVLAIIPGTSRSGVTILAGLLLGCSRYVAAEFTFYLAIPVMAGASGLKIFKFLKAGTGFIFPQQIILIFGMAVAYLVSLLVIRFLMGYIKKHDFKVFGYYRIILGVVVLLVTLFS